MYSGSKACDVIPAGLIQQTAACLPLAPVVVTERRTGRMALPHPRWHPTLNTQVRYLHCFIVFEVAVPSNGHRGSPYANINFVAFLKTSEFILEFMNPLFTAGPKLYKEPSAKSNKHIIQNALAHCCLAGKVNEGQKNKILEVTLPFGFIYLVCKRVIYVLRIQYIVFRYK